MRHLPVSRSTSTSIAKILGALLILLGFVSPAFSQPFVHQLFSSNMVLQRDASDPVWGWTTPGATVNVTINGQTRTATAGSDGRWQVLVGPFSAGGPYTLQVTGPQSVTFSNVMFGDVFLCSGQSNMEWTVNGAYNASAEVADSVNYPNIRCFTVPKVPSLTPQANLTGGTWQAAGSSTTGNFTATGYFTAREIFKQQNVPIGIISAAWGGTQIQSWVKMSTAAGIADFTQTIYNQAVQAPNADTIAGHYNGMISPVAPFRIKAAIWYQGEFNSGRGQQYSRLLPGLFSDWRTLFGQPNLQFIVIQLPNNDAAQTQPVETGGWAEIREAQVNGVNADSNRSRIVNTIDIGEGNLHPLNKQDVGLRASWAAANLLYGQGSVVSQGPIFTGATVSGGTIQCTFSNVGAGLMVGTKNPQTPLSAVQQVSGGTLNGFAIAGSDRVFRFANATITGTNTVSVSSPSVPSPLYVRYAWANNPNANLYNKITNSGGTVINGLPAGSFRNDPIYKLNVNDATGGRESYTIPNSGNVTASVPSGHTFHHWGGDTAALASTTANPTNATLSNLYTTVRAYFTLNLAPTASVAAQVGQNVAQWSSLPNAHYNVLRATTSGGPYTTIASDLGTLSYTDRAIIDGTTYYYRAAGVNEVGQGPVSNTVSATAIGAAASGDNPPNETSAHAFDGVIGTKWFVPNVSTAWLRYNYGSGNAKNVVGYVVTSANDVPGRDPKNWQLQGSNNTSTWTTLDTRTNETFSARFLPKSYTFTNANSYQYYRLNITSNNAGTTVGVQISELSLATSSTPNQPLNRTGWTYNASQTQGGVTPAAVADGNLSTRWSPGASQVPGQWFLVDMEASKIFHQLVLDPGTSTNDYPRGYQVHVSNDGVNWGSPVATGAGFAGAMTISFPQQLARYIRITQTGSDGLFWSISELNVNY